MVIDGYSIILYYHIVIDLSYTIIMSIINVNHQRSSSCCVFDQKKQITGRVNPQSKLDLPISWRPCGSVPTNKPAKSHDSGKIEYFFVANNPSFLTRNTKWAANRPGIAHQPVGLGGVETAADFGRLFFLGIDQEETRRMSAKISNLAG